MKNLRKLKSLVCAHIGQRIKIQHPGYNPIVCLIVEVKADHFVTCSLHGLKSQVHFGSASAWTISDDNVSATKASENDPQTQRVRITFLLPTTVTIYGKQFRKTHRGDYPWDCNMKSQFPNAMIYRSVELGWCTEFCSEFVDRDKTLDSYE